MPRQWHYRSPAENLACTSCLLRSAEDNLMTQMHESWGGRFSRSSLGNVHLPDSLSVMQDSNDIGVRQEGEQLRLLSAEEMAQKSGLFGRKGGGSASLKAAEHAIHCVRCSQPFKQVHYHAPRLISSHACHAFMLHCRPWHKYLHIDERAGELRVFLL